MLPSRHFFQLGDTVQHRDGTIGTVEESRALYAVIRWEDGRIEEVEQLDPLITVIALGSTLAI